MNSIDQENYGSESVNPSRIEACFVHRSITHYIGILLFVVSIPVTGAGIAVMEQSVKELGRLFPAHQPILTTVVWCSLIRAQ